MGRGYKHSSGGSPEEAPETGYLEGVNRGKTGLKSGSGGICATDSPPSVYLRRLAEKAQGPSQRRLAAPRWNSRHMPGGTRQAPCWPL